MNARGFSHRGVALVYDSTICSFKALPYMNPDNFEVLPCVGSLPGHSRKMVVVSCYVPPGYEARRGKACMEYITDLVLHVKAKYRDPYLVIAGDFNQWDVKAALSDYHDLSEADVSPTRGSRCLDRIFDSFKDSLVEAGSYPPLEAEESTPGRLSDHRIAFADATLPRIRTFKRLSLHLQVHGPGTSRGLWPVVDRRPLGRGVPCHWK